MFVIYVEPGSPAAVNFLDVAGGNTEIAMRWLGGATMLVAVCCSLVKFLGVKAIHATDSDEGHLLEVDPGVRRWLSIAIVLGVVTPYIIAVSGWPFASTTIWCSDFLIIIDCSIAIVSIISSFCIRW